MRGDPPVDDGRAPGLDRLHHERRQAAPPGERGRHCPHAPHFDPRELRIGTRLRRAQRQRVLRLIWPPRGDRARPKANDGFPGLTAAAAVTADQSNALEL